MADFKILRIRFRWIGEWTAGYSYIKDDVVRYGGKTYVSLKTHISAANFYNNLEAVDTQIPPQSDPFWELMFDGYEWTQDWQTATFYQVGDIAKKNGIVYICVESHVSTTNEVDFTDDLDALYWIIYTSTDNWRYDWTISTSYSVNDIVKYSGIIYRCVTAHVSASTTALGLEDDQNSWELISDTQYWRGDWTTTTRYRKNDIIKYNGRTYVCNTGHFSASTVLLGLENDQGFWTLFYDNIEYQGTWSPSSVRYKLRDIVKYGAGLWICTEYHTSSNPFDETKWEVYFPGFQFESEWISSTVYQKGDVVSYGGYDYYAKTNNVNQIPSVESDDWELLKTSFKIQGDWNSNTTYKVGDVVRRGAMLYVSISDSLNQETTNTVFWELLIPGERWIGTWEFGTEYLIGDIVTYISNSYRCLTKHTGSLIYRPDLDIGNIYWTLLVEGNRINVLLEPGDIKTFGVNNDGSTINAIRRAIGSEGQVIKANNNESNWTDFNVSIKVYYVSTDGSDSNSGDNLDTPWRTVRHACQNITGPATIFIKTGSYQEILPISIPAQVALVGDELRGTTIEPLLGYETQNMFYVRNGSGIRNMTFRGLAGSLGPANINGTRRPTAGAYVSLDPGGGAGDNNVWITTRSPYIQNVTTLGVGCIGMKIDGSLHDGGNRSIVANDFTQVISDGIGIWCTNLGLTEQVSVFSYYAHIGYLAENGGKIRATNGNSSYGTFGCVSEGFDLNEIPISCTVNNRYYEAQVGSVVTNSGNIFALEYTNAGTNYTADNGGATFAFSGAGINASASGNEIRDGAIYQSRIYTPGDSSVPGGGSYLTISNNAQSGDTSSITLAATDQNTASNYIGMRIFIIRGTGSGQYAYIYSYNNVSKTALILRESDDQAGWDHIIPGYPIVSVFDTTTVYKIEPKVTFNFPGFSDDARSMPAAESWVDTVWTGTAYVAIALGTSSTARSTNGITWALGGNLPSSSTWNNVAAGAIGATTYTITIASGSDNASYSSDSGIIWAPSVLTASAAWCGIEYGNNQFIAIANAGTTNISTNGTSWTAGGVLPISTGWSGLAYGNDVWVAVSPGSTQAAYSIDNGTTWISTTLPSSSDWISISYGNGRFVAIAQNSIDAAYSFDGISWVASTLPASIFWTKVRYGQGVFLAVAGSTTTVAYSNDGYQWRTSGDDSTQFALPSSQSWSSIAFGNPSNNGLWVVVANGVTNAATILTGRKAIARTTIASGRITKISMIEPGSGYLSTPSITVFDPNNTSSVVVNLRVGNGALGPPTFSNRGTGFIAASTTVSINGNGFGDNYQTGQDLIVSNLSLLPGPGANLSISGINDVTYRIVTITVLGGSLGSYTAKFRISPILDVEESPDHGTSIIIREKYSQVRLTGHDFLDIGSGNFQNSNYPNIPILQLAPENEVFEKSGGRVFYTSTDQNGNFRVGELFKVDQATGTVTISADLFNLSGLSEISLGGVSVGGTGVVINEFSTDSTFTADSNNIIPTQRAIKAYLNARISGGGASALTTILTAGVVRIGPQVITTTTGNQIQVPAKVNFTKGIDGDMLQLNYFASSFSSDPE